MAKRLIKDSTLDAIAVAIRTMGGADGLMTPAEMPEKILNIPVNVEGGTDLPELSNPAGSGQILSGYQAINGSGIAITGSHVCPTVGTLTKDGTATPEQVAAGATFYAGGEKREGTVYTVGSNLNEFGDLSASDDRITLSTPFSDPTLFPAGTKHNVRAYLSNFGDATADDVAKGKKFTSAAGFKVEGNAEIPQVIKSIPLESYQMYYKDFADATHVKVTDKVGNVSFVNFTAPSFNQCKVPAQNLATSINYTLSVMLTTSGGSPALYFCLYNGSNTASQYKLANYVSIELVKM